MKTFSFVLVLLLFYGCTSTKTNFINHKESKAILIKSAEIIYPELAKQKSIEGDVELYILVDTSGFVKNTRVVKKSKSPLLDSAAIQYSRNLVFAPIIRNNEPVVRWIKWRVSYRLENTFDLQTAIRKIKLLVFTNDNFNRHDTHEAAVNMLRQLSIEFGFKIFFTEDPAYFSIENLSDYNVVLFANTNGSILNTDGKNALINFINKGGGFVGIHSSIETETEWEWYSRLLGSNYKNHIGEQKSVINVIDRNHPSTSHLPTNWQWKDNLYQWLNQFDQNVKVLAIIDGREPEKRMHPHPVIWCQQFEGGRSWYSSLGHLSENYSDPNFTKLILGGILWASGKAH